MKPIQSDNRWLIITTVMLIAILEVMDSTIVNVALPAMMPTLGANAQQITWVLTSYVVASAVMLPLTGYLSDRLGMKQLLIINILGFMATSLLAGLATSLDEMIVFRLLQGAFGAALVPLSQAIIRHNFPFKEQGKAMAWWGLGILAAPVFGPTLGGYITAYSSWRWVFYVNIPFCLLALALTFWVIPKTKPIQKSLDWLGVSLMFIGIGSLQILLDQGNAHSWFASNEILLLAVISIITLLWFGYRTVKHAHPVFSFSIYRNRNFSLCSLVLMVYVGCLFGLITLLPIMMETLFGYSTLTTGITLAPLGILSAVGMSISSKLMYRINVKYILGSGLIISAIGAYWLASVNLHATQELFYIATGILGFGMGLFMIPIATYSLATVPQKDITTGSGLFSYARMLGSSIGISLLITVVSRMIQVNWHALGAHISKLNQNTRLWLHGLPHHFSMAVGQALLGRTLAQQAHLLAFIDAYWLVALVFILLLPSVFLMKTVDSRCLSSK